MTSADARTRESREERRSRLSNADQEGKGQEIAIPRGAKLRPMAAVQEWLHAAGITENPVFRKVDRHGKVRRA